MRREEQDEKREGVERYGESDIYNIAIIYHNVSWFIVQSSTGNKIQKFLRETNTVNVLSVILSIISVNVAVTDQKRWNYCC